MDERFRVNDSPRPDVPGWLAEMPVVTIAWRAMRAAERDRRRERERMEELAAEAAGGIHRLRRMARGVSGEAAGQPWVREAITIADRLEGALAGIGVTILSPEGEVFTTELMEVLHSAAQIPDPKMQTPRVAEVLAPAVLLRGKLVRMGSAVIAVPAEAPRDGPGAAESHWEA
jgi:hypothetical protein